jgi:hypothetical protein
MAVIRKKLGTINDEAGTNLVVNSKRTTSSVLLLHISAENTSAPIPQTGGRF